MKEIDDAIRQMARELTLKTDRIVFEGLSKDPEFQQYMADHYYIEIRGNLKVLRKIGEDAPLISWTETVRITVGDKIEEISL